MTFENQHEPATTAGPPVEADSVALLDAVAMPLLLLDRGCRVRFRNRALRRLEGDDAAPLGRPLVDAYPTLPAAWIASQVAAALNAAGPLSIPWERAPRLDFGGGDRAPRGCHFNPVENGEGVLLCLHDATEAALYRQNLLTALAQVEHANQCDRLTGALNRGSWEQRVREECRRVTRYGGELGLLLIDIEGFGEINRRRGHHVGDQLLCRLIALLAVWLRATDLIGRYGGGSFALLLPETGAEGAYQLGGRVLAGVADTPFEIDGEAITVALSLGAAGSDLHGVDCKRLVARADAALRDAKRRGGGCVGRTTAEAPSVAAIEPGDLV